MGRRKISWRLAIFSAVVTWMIPMASLTETLYHETFDKGPGAWLTGKNKSPGTPETPHGAYHRNILGYYGEGVPLRWSKVDGRSGGFAYSESPWYFDDNHGEFMWLHLIFVVYSSDVALVGRDLRGTRIALSLRGRDLNLEGTRLFFWITGGEDEKHYRNWALTSRPIEDELLDGEWHDLNIALVDDENKWSFMGLINGGLARQIRVLQSLSSGKGTLTSILAGTHAAWGFLLCGVDPVRQPTGKIDITDFSITPHPSAS